MGFILSTMTEFPRKMCPPELIFLADRFSTDTSVQPSTVGVAIIHHDVGKDTQLYSQ